MKKIFVGVMVAVLSYLLLILFDNMLHLSRAKQFIIAVIIGILFYMYGHTIIPFITDLFNQMDGKIVF